MTQSARRRPTDGHEYQREVVAAAWSPLWSLATTWSKNPAGKTVSGGAATTGLADGGAGSPLEDGFWPAALRLCTGGPSEPAKASKA